MVPSRRPRFLQDGPNYQQTILVWLSQLTVFVDVPSGQEDFCPEGGHPELARQRFEDHVFMCFCVAMDTDGHAVGLLLLLSCLKIVASVCLCVVC